MKVQTQTEELRRLRRTNLELIFSDHNAYCLPPCQNKCPSHIDIPGFLKANAEADWRESDADLQAHDPVPERARPGLPGAVRGALPARRGGRGDRHPRQPPLRRRPGPQVDARRGRRPAAAVRAPGAVRPARRGHRLRPGRHGRRVLPAAGRPRRDGLRARPVARRDAPLRDPAVPAAQGRGPRGRVRVGHPARRQDRLQRRPRHGLHARRPDLPGLRCGRRRDRLLRHEQAGHPGRGRRRGARRPRVPAHRDARPALPGPRRQAGRGHRRRVHLDGLLADVDPPGRRGGDARLPPRHEGHAGRRTRSTRRSRKASPPSSRPARSGSSPTRRATSPASSSSGWRSARPTPPAGAARSRRPAPSSRSPATACCWPSARAPT